MVLEQGPVDGLRLAQISELEQREPEEVPRALVTGLAPQRLFEKLARGLCVAALQRLGPGGQSAVEFLVRRGIVFVEPSRLFGPLRAAVHQREPPTEAGVGFAPIRFKSA
jgi:hypothetical protein